MASIRVRTHQVHGLLIFVLLLWLGGCASPAGRFDDLARQGGLRREPLAGERFDHVLYHRPGAGRTLHVYLSGDGTPWRTRHSPALDPTPRRPMVLSLMALDPAPVLLLGRPCYHGAMRGCSVWDWTAGRYSPAVLESMAGALERWLAAHPTGELALIGYSGGGSLAMLLAGHWEARRQRGARLAPVTMLVTIAANLDIRRWAALHDYSPLADSLNPAEQAPLPAHVAQWHLLGERDRNVPPALVEQALAAQSGARVLRFAGADHGCCWAPLWRAFLHRTIVSSATAIGP